MNNAATENGRLLAITAVGPNAEHLGLELVRGILKRDCRLHDCRIAPLGDSLSASFLVAGNWSALGRLESALPTLAENLGLQIHFRRTSENPPRSEYRPYGVEVIAPQRADLLIHVLEFFKSHEVHLSEIVMQNYHSNHTGAAMSNLQLMAHIPVTQHPQSMREAFMDLCDELNADGLLDPIKT